LDALSFDALLINALLLLIALLGHTAALLREADPTPSDDNDRCGEYSHRKAPSSIYAELAITGRSATDHFPEHETSCLSGLPTGLLL
jgi:hypothetical protein